MYNVALQVVSEEEGAQLARQFFGGMPFFETSAKQNLRVDDMFGRIVADVKAKMLADHGTGADGGHKLPMGGRGSTRAKRGCC